MAVLEYVYRINPPFGVTVDDTMTRVVPATELMLTANKWVKGAQLDIHDDHLLLYLAMAGHDRWWIRRRAPYIIVTILTRSDLEAKDAELVEAHPLPNLKQARFWSSGEHNRGARLFRPVDGTEPPPRKDHKCKGCKKPGPFHETRSGWHQTYRGQGR